MLRLLRGGEPAVRSTRFSVVFTEGEQGKPKHDLTPVSKAEPLPARKRRTRHSSARGSRKNLDFDNGSVSSAKDKLKADEEKPGKEQRKCSRTKVKYAWMCITVKRLNHNKFLIKLDFVF